MALKETNLAGSNGTAVPTSDAGQLLVDTRVAALYAGQNGNAYTIVGAADTSSATADFLWLKNHDPRDLIIYKIKMYTPDTDCIISVKINVTGSNTGGDLLAPANVKAGGPLANVTCYQEDGDMALSGGTTIDTLYLDKDFVGEQMWEYPAGIILPQNSGMVYYTATDPVSQDISSTTYFYYADPK